MLLEIPFPNINPVAIALGPLKVHWYGLMYLLAFAIAYLLMRSRLRHEPFASTGWTRDDPEDLLMFAIGGVILGGRLGYVLFYEPARFFAHPIDIIKVWDGGMSFHGGAIGVVIAIWAFARRKKRPFLEVADFLVPTAPLGLAAGRIGNFINGELWGRPAPESLPWAMRFPTGGDVLRHPSQLYQALLEGVLLFVLLWLYARKPRRTGRVAAVFLAGYGCFRFIAEYFREPDAQLGILSLGLSMGQWLSVPMILAGLVLWIWGSRDRSTASDDAADESERTGSSDDDPVDEAVDNVENLGESSQDRP